MAQGWNDIKLLTTSGKPLPDATLGQQTAFRLPNGTYTSNPYLANIAKQQIAKANKQALTRTALKGLGIVPMSVQFYKNIAFPIANDLYQGFIMGNPDKSKTLQTALGLAGIDRNGNRVAREKISSINDAGVPLEILDDAQLTGGKSVQVNNKSGQVSVQPSAQVARQVASQLASQPKVTQQKVTEQQANIDAINDYISKLQDVNQPYIDALQNYSNSYDDLVRRNFNTQRYFTALAGLSGNQGYTKLADALNPINNEVNKLNTLKLLRDAQAGDINAINEVMGNLAMAQEMGLPPEAAFANKNLLTAMTMRDRNLTNREIAQLNNAAKLQVALQNAQNRLAVQNLRNKGNLGVANVYMGGGVAPGLNNQGLPQTPYQPLANKQQGGSNLQQAFDMYANK